MNFLKELVRAVCINDSHYPNEIKASNRPKKGQEYTIIATAKMIITGELGVKLAEIDTGLAEYPYYKASRFAIREEDIPKLGEIQEIDIEELLEETLLT